MATRKNKKKQSVEVVVPTDNNNSLVPATEKKPEAIGTKITLDDTVPFLMKANDVLKNFEYRGFNRLEVRNQLTRVNKISQSNLVQIFCAYNKIGANTEKWTKEYITDSGAASAIQFLIDKIPIVNDKNDDSVELAITPSRIISAFADFYAIFIEGNLGARNGIKGRVPKGLPVSICFPGGAAFIKAEEVNLIALYKVWALDFDYSIAKENSSFKEKTMWDYHAAYTRVNQYVNIQISKSDFTKDQVDSVRLNCVTMGTADPAAILKSIGGASGSGKELLDLFSVDEKDVKKLVKEVKSTKISKKKSSKKTKKTKKDGKKEKGDESDNSSSSDGE